MGVSTWRSRTTLAKSPKRLIARAAERARDAPRDGRRERFDHGVDLGGRIIAAHPEAQRGIDALVRQTRARAARAIPCRPPPRTPRPRRCAMRPPSERISVSASARVDRDVEVPGQPRRQRSVHLDARRFGRAGRRAADRAARRMRAGSPSASAPLRETRGLAESDDARDVERARAQALLLPAALRLRPQAKPRLAPRAHVERADALRAVHLVRGQAHRDRRPRPRRRRACGRAPARRRCGTRCRARGTARRSRPPAAACRSRCSPPSRDTRMVSGRSASAIALRRRRPRRRRPRPRVTAKPSRSRRAAGLEHGRLLDGGGHDVPASAGGARDAPHGQVVRTPSRRT